MNKKYIMPSISVFEVKPAVVMQTASETLNNTDATGPGLGKGGGFWSDDEDEDFYEE